MNRRGFIKSFIGAIAALSVPKVIGGEQPTDAQCHKDDPRCGKEINEAFQGVQEQLFGSLKDQTLYVSKESTIEVIQDNYARYKVLEV